MRSNLKRSHLAEFASPPTGRKLQAMKREGHTMAVIRPADPERAINRADEIMKMPVFTPEQLAAQEQAFQRMVDEQQYTFVGIQGYDPQNPTSSPLLDPRTMRVVDQSQTGDSLISWEDMQNGAWVVVRPN